MISKKDKQMLKKSPTVKFIKAVFDSVKVNFGIKLIFLAIGIALWLNINLERDYETAVDIPIRLANIAKGKTLLEPIPEKARIKIRSKGKSILLSDFSKDVYFEIDGSTIEDSAAIRINMDYFVNSSGAELEPLFIFHPQEIFIRYDDYKMKKVPVEIDFRFSPAPGYVTLGDFTMFPDSVLLTGPKSKLSKIKYLRTVSIFEKDVTAPFSRKIPLILPDSVSVSYSDRHVTAAQKVERKGSNTFKAQIVVLNKPESVNLVLNPISVDITVTGPVSILQNITAKDFSVTADMREMDEKTNIVPVSAETKKDILWTCSVKDAKVILY